MHPLCMCSYVDEYMCKYTSTCASRQLRRSASGHSLLCTASSTTFLPLLSFLPPASHVALACLLHTSALAGQGDRWPAASMRAHTPPDGVLLCTTKCTRPHVPLSSYARAGPGRRGPAAAWPPPCRRARWRMPPSPPAPRP